MESAAGISGVTVVRVVRALQGRTDILLGVEPFDDTGELLPAAVAEVGA
jgi:hypothetical protein